MIDLKRNCSCNLLISLLVLICLSGCYTTRVETKSGPGTEVRSKTVHSLFWGLVNKPQVITTPLCDSLGSKGMAEVTVKNNLGYSLITVVTLGIWSPMRVAWKCSKPCQMAGHLGGDDNNYALEIDNGTPLFPWPPPEFSARHVLKKKYFKDDKTLGDMNKTLENVLDPLNYSDRSYYYIPNGFALVTRIEQITKDGQSLNPPERWSVKASPMKNLSFPAYIKALLFPPDGHFRIIVFAVTDQPFNSSGRSVSQSTAMNWLHDGLNVLPDPIAKNKLSNNHNCTVLIYEFKKDVSKDAKLLNPGTLTGADHLIKSKLMKLFDHQ
ncbi:hypothetical protein IM792_08210 [Mucilaginibacter sp. JRF]|uniref:Bor/Iss family lipoprotein n=1 Tax=Mucilaginibacter sp. JRF TaxID=2780088 RepID=UPI0018829FBF|nr:hypothetical protein [Mucilaginibacter sp. JRF]MBE9584427.1 hypothetical protein [Mucilaginibacter sp. JRF]